MKFLVLISLLFVPVASVADVTVCFDLPQASAPRSSQLCEEYRKAKSVRPADWDVPTCAASMVREAMLMLETRYQKKDAKRIITDAVNAADIAYKASFPTPYTPARCGDSVVDDTDPDRGEQCDDGNLIDGDGCSASCQNE